MKKALLILMVIFVLPFSIIYGQYPNIRVNNPNSSDAEEVTIAINPVNPDILAGGANISYFYRSTDGGNSWIQDVMNSSLGVWGDPCVVFDSLGNLFYGHLSNPANGYWIDRIVIQRSTDNGMTWNDGVGIGYQYPKNQDKEWIAVDMTQSPYRNYVYTSWTEFDDYGSSSSSDSSRILFARSTDHGITFSDPIRLNTKGGNCIDSDNTTEGAVPAVGPEGQVYVAWAGPLGLMFDKSTDGGETFGDDIFISDMPGGWDQDVPGIYRANGLPITACDISNSPFRGNVYVCWSDQRNGMDNIDVFVARSTDEGETWLAPVKVNTDNSTRHQFFPWMTVDPVTGIVYVVFYDRRNTTGTATDVYVARSVDGGETFEDFKVSESSFTPNPGVFFGDYTNIAAFNGKVYPIWMRLDNYSLSVWTTIIEDSSSVVPVEFSSFTAKVNKDEVLLEWETATEINNRGFEIERTAPPNLPEGEASGNSPFGGKEWGFVVIGYVDGKGTTTNNSKYSFTDDNLPNGIYQYRIKQIDYDGNFDYSSTIEVSVNNVNSFNLIQNYPNPFNPATTISYQLPERSFVTIKVFDVIGNEIGTILNENKSAGTHEITFNTNSIKDDLTSGMYLYRITAVSESGDTFDQTKKMILLR